MFVTPELCEAADALAVVHPALPTVGCALGEGEWVALAQVLEKRIVFLFNLKAKFLFADLTPDRRLRAGLSVRPAALGSG